MKKLLAWLMCLCLLMTPVLASGEASGGASKEAVAIDGASITVDEDYFAGSVTENGVKDFTIAAENEQVIGLSVSGDASGEPVVIENGRIELQQRGTAISLTGGSAVIDNVVVWNKATEGVSASGSSVATLKNVVIYGEQDVETYRRGSPFALGLAGSMRVTNAVGQSQITYEDSLVVSGSWAPLSTDSGTTVCLTTRNVLAGVGWLEVAEDGKEYTATKEVNGVTYGFTLGDSANYNSGYVSYCDSGFHNYYYDSEFYGTDYVIILSSSVSSATMVNDRCYSDRIGIMWHKNQGGTVDITGGSLYADRCLFMMKGYSDLDSDGCFANLLVDGTELSVGEENVLLQLMTSDDCGLNYEALQVPEIEDDFSRVECLLGTMVQKTYSEGFPPTIMYVFDVNGEEVGVSAAEYDAFVAENPTAEPVMVEYEPQQDCSTTFKNLSVEGDIYNAVWQAYQAVDVTFDNAEITGVISSAWANHVDAEGNALPGGTVIEADSSLDCHLGIGRVKNTAAPAVNNPVYLTLENGAVWNVTGTSYLAKLTVDSAVINGVVTVDGEAVDVSAGGSWEGDIVVAPAAGGEITWADYQAWLVSILPEISPFPEEVGAIVMATTGWDDIDMDNGPWGKIFGEDAFHCSTWEEFSANGGAGIYNADFVDLPAEDAPAA
ncbi:MAG: hypothetical protein ACI3W7_10380 [Oscillospiraceae bacterium]